MQNPAYLYDIKQHTSGYHTEPCLPVQYQVACQWLPYRTLPTCMTSSSMPVVTMPKSSYLYEIKQHASGYHTKPCLHVQYQAACQWLSYRTLPTCTTSNSMPVATIPNPAYLYNIKQHASGYTCTISSSMPVATIPNPAYRYDIKQHARGYHTEPCLPVRHQAACQRLPCRALPTCTISSNMPAATMTSPAYLYDIKQHASGYHSIPCLPARHQATCQRLPLQILPTCTTSSIMPVATMQNPTYLHDIKQHVSGYHSRFCLPVRHQATCQRLPYRTLPTCTTSSNMPVVTNPTLPTCTTSSNMPANIIPNPAVKNGKNTCRPICHDDSSGTPDINCPFVFPPPKHAQQTLDFSRSGRLESMSSLLCTSGPWCKGVALADMSSRPGVPYSCFSMLWNTDDAKSGC